jgi:hypothetical protein
MHRRSRDPRGAELTGGSDIGLAAGSRLTFDSLGLVGYLPANAETVGSGLETLARFLHVNNNAAVPYLVGEDGLAALGCEPFGPGYWGIGQLMFGALAILTNALRTICGRDFRLRAVTFVYGAPADRHAFRRFFRAPYPSTTHEAAFASTVRGSRGRFQPRTLHAAASSNGSFAC